MLVGFIPARAGEVTGTERGRVIFWPHTPADQEPPLLGLFV